MSSDHDYIYLSIYDEKGFLAGVLRQQAGSYPKYAGYLYKQSISWVKDIIYNMNKRLIVKKDDVPREIFGLRLVEEAGIDGDLIKLVPTRTPKTNMLLEKYRDDYCLSPRLNEYFEMTLDEADANQVRPLCGLTICLNINTNMVVLGNFFNVLEAQTYCDIKMQPIEKAREIRGTMLDFPNDSEDPNWDYHMLNSINFNMLEDVYEFVEENKNGFKGKNPGTFSVIR